MQLTAKAMLLIALLVSSPLVSAQTTTVAQTATPQCTGEGFSFSGKQLALNTGNGPLIQRIFIIKNIAGYTVLVNNNDSNHPGGNAGWATKINGGASSAIAVNQRNLSLFCMAYNPPQFGVTTCQNVLSVCAFPPQKYGIGSFWIAENKSDAEIQNALVQRKVFG
jgi:hypothetical protein